MLQLCTTNIVRWLRRRNEQPPLSRVAPEPPDPNVLAREHFHRLTIRQFHSVLKEAVRALHAKPEEQEREVRLLDELGEHLEAPPAESVRQYTKLEQQVQSGCEQVSEYISRQRTAMLAREQELADVVALLTRGMAESTQDNASFYNHIRAEGERIAEASRSDDLVKLKSVLTVAMARLNNLVVSKENQDQSRIDALSIQVEALKNELQAARQKAETDPLTNALNRRAFDNAITGLVRRYQGTRRSFVVILFDIDNFKRINDQFGHPVGDRALIAFTRQCRALLRPEDMLARYGGEEFAVVLDGASRRDGLKRASSICEGIARQRFAIDDKDPRHCLTMTVSAGVATFTREDSVTSVIQRADGALYRAKANGKNRAVLEETH